MKDQFDVLLWKYHKTKLILFLKDQNGCLIEMD